MAPRRRSVLPDLLTLHGATGSVEAIDEIRRVIVAGGIAPGTAIPINEVATTLGVSTIPVREALRQLIGEGLVEHRPNLGFTTARLTADEFAQLYLVRESIEQCALAASLAIATESDNANAARACAALEDAILHEDLAAYHVASRAFHLALVAPSGMSRLLHMLELTWNLTEPIQPMAYVPLIDRLRFHEHHKAMLDAFVQRDLARLIALSHEHNTSLNSAISKLPPDSGLLV